MPIQQDKIQYRAWVDGRWVHGRGTWAVVITDNTGTVIKLHIGAGLVENSMEAERHALLAAIREAETLGITDESLVLYTDCLSLASWKQERTIPVVWIPREQNQAADALTRRMDIMDEAAWWPVPNKNEQMIGIAAHHETIRILDQSENVPPQNPHLLPAGVALGNLPLYRKIEHCLAQHGPMEIHQLVRVLNRERNAVLQSIANKARLFKLKPDGALALASPDDATAQNILSFQQYVQSLQKNGKQGPETQRHLNAIRQFVINRILSKSPTSSAEAQNVANEFLAEFPNYKLFKDTVEDVVKAILDANAAQEREEIYGTRCAILKMGTETLLIRQNHAPLIYILQMVDWMCAYSAPDVALAIHRRFQLLRASSVAPVAFLKRLIQPAATNPTIVVSWRDRHGVHTLSGQLYNAADAAKARQDAAADTENRAREMAAKVATIWQQIPHLPKRAALGLKTATLNASARKVINLAGKIEPGAEKLPEVLARCSEAVAMLHCSPTKLAKHGYVVPFWPEPALPVADVLRFREQLATQRSETLSQTDAIHLLNITWEEGTEAIAQGLLNPVETLLEDQTHVTQASVNRCLANRAILAPVLGRQRLGIIEVAALFAVPRRTAEKWLGDISPVGREENTHISWPVWSRQQVLEIGRKHGIHLAF